MPDKREGQEKREGQRGSVLEVFLVFLRLGCISFGGPIAHLGYFQKELVERRRWSDEDAYAEMIGLAQSLPGPSSSQVCFGMGILRAGWLGGLAAWTGFTLPSALLMFGFAFGLAMLQGSFIARLIHGLQLVAVAVVAQAVMTMQRSSAPDRQRMSIALGALAVVLFAPAQMASLLAIAGGGIAGLAIFRKLEVAPSKPVLLAVSKKLGTASGLALGGSLAGLLVALLVLLLIAARWTRWPGVELASTLYRSGALVFGGGHVVLPLLEGAVVTPGWVSQRTFLAGYGAAQALPGPLFTFGGYLGASIERGPNRLLLGIIGLIALSAPGLLAMAAALPFWGTLRSAQPVQSALRGVNAAVVGILIAALYLPLWKSTVLTSVDFLFALVGFVMLTVWKAPSWVVVCAVSVGYVVAGLSGN